MLEISYQPKIVQALANDHLLSVDHYEIKCPCGLVIESENRIAVIVAYNQHIMRHMIPIDPVYIDSSDMELEHNI